ncbi:MAG: hypothetical protein VZR33_03965 [Methanosphaera sp.]|nr:hypothetical protein [Methanosphaera sp.]
MTEDGSLYYNYTNKGSVYQFDLSKLTPEERQKFSRLNDRQKLRFITLKDMEEPGKMKNEIAIRPDFNDDKSNERENDLRALTAKLEYLNKIMKTNKIGDIGEIQTRKLKDMEGEQKKFVQELIRDSDGLVTLSDINYVVSANENATIQTLKKYYQAMLDNLKTEGEQIKQQKKLLNGFSKGLSNASSESKYKLIGDIINGLKNGENLFKLEKDIKDKYNIDINTVDLVNIKNNIPKPAYKQIQEAKETEDSLADVISNTFGKTKDEILTIIRDKDLRDQLINEITMLANDIEKMDVDGTTINKINKASIPNYPYDTENYNLSYLDDDAVEKLYQIQEKIRDLPENYQEKESKKMINSILKEFNIPQMLDVISEEKKQNIRPSVYDFMYNILNSNDVFKSVGDKHKGFDTAYEPDIFSDEKIKTDKLRNNVYDFVQTIKAIDKNGDFRTPALKLLKDKMEGKSGSIRDKIRKIFRGNTEEDIKKISEAQAQQHNQTQGDLQSLKDRVNVLEQEVKNLQTNQFQQPQQQPQPQPQVKPSFLNDIGKPFKPLKPTEPSPKLPNPPDDSLTSQFKKIMEERRKDIEPDEVEESDDEEWLASGITKMSLADFLMNL